MTQVMPKYVQKWIHNVTIRRSSSNEHVLEEIEKTYGDITLCSKNNLAHLLYPEIFEIKHPSRFYNARAEEILKSWRDCSAYFHRLPKRTQRKIIASREFERLFQSQILPTLLREVQTKEFQKKLKLADKELTTLQQLYRHFLEIGLKGYVNLMPVEFKNIINKKLDEVFELMQMVTMYSKRIAPKKAKLKDFRISKRYQ